MRACRALTQTYLYARERERAREGEKERESEQERERVRTRHRGRGRRKGRGRVRERVRGRVRGARDTEGVGLSSLHSLRFRLADMNHWHNHVILCVLHVRAHVHCNEM